MAASDGGVFSFGVARFLGSAVGLTGTGLVVDLEPTPDGAGYWMADSNGGVFALGDAAYFGSATGNRLRGSVVGMASALAPAVDPQDYTISGDATATLSSGTTSSIDLRIANPNAVPITVVGNTVSVTTSDPACPATDFDSPRGLGRPVTVPAGTSATLGQLGVAEADWPTIGMLDTKSDQDACTGVRLTLRYQGEAIG